VITKIEPYSQQIMPDEQQIYEHLLRCVQVESPSQMIERFRALFISGLSYSDPEVLAALDRITTANSAEQFFKLFLNRCCYILINRWQARPQYQSAIPELVSLFNKPVSSTAAGLGRSRAVKRLRQLVELFTRSEQYQTLHRLAEFICQTPTQLGAVDNLQLPSSIVQSIEAAEPKPLASLIRRYPYLYDHCLLNQDSSCEQQQAVRQIQAEVQKQFEANLSQYLIYQIRRSRSPESLSQPAKNPTLLSDYELWHALKQFVGKAEGSYSYRDLAQRFLIHTQQTRTYQSFKDDFYQYLVSSIDPKYGRYRFNNQLHNYLTNIAAQSNSQKFSDFLFVRTCSQVLNFLVVEGSQQPDHYIFVDLVTNIGITATIGLLLKIVLICKKVKPHSEKRFAILFNHYESSEQSELQWLVHCLENLNVAWSTHFGTVDFSSVNQIV